MSDQWQVATGAAAGTKICVRDVPKISNLPFVRAPYTLRKAQKMLAPPPRKVGGGGHLKIHCMTRAQAIFFSVGIQGGIAFKMSLNFLEIVGRFTV